MSTLQHKIDCARDPRTHWERLLTLAYCDEVEVRRALLDNPNLCPIQEDGKIKPDILVSLASEFPEEVSRLPLFVLHALVQPVDEMQLVVFEVISRTTDHELARTLFSLHGRYWKIQYYLAKSTRAHTGLLHSLFDTYGSDHQIRSLLARNPKTPLSILRKLGNKLTEPSEIVREEVASNPSATEDILHTLGRMSTEPEYTVRRAVAKNKKTPADLLVIMADPEFESSVFVRQSVCSHHQFSANVFPAILQTSNEPVGIVSPATIESLANGGTPCRKT